MIFLSVYSNPRIMPLAGARGLDREKASRPSREIAARLKESVRVVRAEVERSKPERGLGA